MRRLGVLAPALLVLVAVAAAPASAGEVVFSSDRCYEREPHTYTCFQGIWTVRDDGTGLRQLTFPPPDGSTVDTAPSWSPDGRWVLFRRPHLPRDYSNWTTTLQALSPETGELRQVGPEAPNPSFSEYGSPDWSPSGDSIVFSTAGSGIWTMTAAGTEMARLTAARDGGPQFSPDGSRIAFVRASDERDELGNMGPPSLLTMARDGSDIAPVFVGEPPAPGGFRHPQIIYRVAWSPDGRRLAVAIREDLYTVAAGGGELEPRGKLGPSVSAGAPFAQLTWSSDLGDALIYSRPMEFPVRPLQRLLLTGPELPATDLAPPISPPPGQGPPRALTGDQSPDWRSSLPAVPVPPDADPPALVPIDADVTGAAVARASARSRLTVRRRSLGFLALDVGGVRRVEVAIARQTRARGRPACRFAGRRGLGRARACSRPVWRRVGHAGDLRRIVRRLKPARYLMRLRATDALGNRTKRPRTVGLRLRR